MASWRLGPFNILCERGSCARGSERKKRVLSLRWHNALICFHHAGKGEGESLGALPHVTLPPLRALGKLDVENGRRWLSISPATRELCQTSTRLENAIHLVSRRVEFFKWNVFFCVVCAERYTFGRAEVLSSMPSGMLNNMSLS